MFKLHGKLTTQQTLVLGILGLIVFLVFWFLLAEAFSEQKAVVSATDSTKVSSVKVYPLLPRPDRVIQSYKDLSQKDGLWPNTFRSIWLNLKGYFWAIILAI